MDSTKEIEVLNIHKLWIESFLEDTPIEQLNELVWHHDRRTAFWY